MKLKLILRNSFFGIEIEIDIEEFHFLVLKLRLKLRNFFFRIEIEIDIDEK